MIPIIMPQVGQDYPTGTIVEWLKCENDPVQKGEVVLRVESEKAIFDVEADATGILLKILYEQGAQVDILKPVALIGQPGETIDASMVSSKAEGSDNTNLRAVEKQSRSPDILEQGGEILVSPAVRKAAERDGIDLTLIKGSGPGGRIIKRDLAAALQQMSLAQAEPEALGEGLSDQDQEIPFGKMRVKIAQRLTHSVQTIPHFYLNIDVDVTAPLARRQQINQESDARISVTDLIIHAVARSLPGFRRMNAHVSSDKIVLKNDVHIGVAVAVEEGLLVPVIPHADQKSLLEISEISAKNAAAARRGSMNPNSAGTFTISTLGMYAIKSYLPIINPPQCTILAVGTAELRVVPVEGKIGMRDMMSLTLAADHRAVDGAYGAGFLNQMKHRLEEVQFD
jgi:pyruvate dehydrogenase E2 component (dihydrolipoamide acetyltransferase)